MPAILLAAIADPMPAPSIAMPASASPRATGRRLFNHADIFDRNATSAQPGHQGGLQVEPYVITADGDASDSGLPRRSVKGPHVVENDGDAPAPERVLGKRRDVTARRQADGGAGLEDPSVRLGDDVEPLRLHSAGVLLSTAIYLWGGASTFA
jgi:hypothetical protein